MRVDIEEAKSNNIVGMETMKCHFEFITEGFCNMNALLIPPSTLIVVSLTMHTPLQSFFRYSSFMSLLFRPIVYSTVLLWSGASFFLSSACLKCKFTNKEHLVRVQFWKSRVENSDKQVIGQCQLVHPKKHKTVR